jgi:tubulin gamma
MLDQFDRLKRRNAFLEQYKKEKLFQNGLEEFDDARYVLLVRLSYPFVTFPIRATCEELLGEYKACESPEYITYVCTMRRPSIVIRGTDIIDTEC